MSPASVLVRDRLRMRCLRSSLQKRNSQHFFHVFFYVEIFQVNFMRLAICSLSCTANASLTVLTGGPFRDIYPCCRRNVAPLLAGRSSWNCKETVFIMLDVPIVSYSCRSLLPTWDISAAYGRKPLGKYTGFEVFPLHFLIRLQSRRNLKNALKPVSKRSLLL